MPAYARPRPPDTPPPPSAPPAPPGPTGSQLLDEWLSLLNPEDAHQIVTLCKCYNIVDDDIVGELNCDDFKDLGVPKHLALLIPWTERGRFDLDDFDDLER